MIIQLNDSFRINIAGSGVILEEKNISGNEKGKGIEKWILISAYSSLERAVSVVIRRGILTTEIEGIQNILNAIKSGVSHLCEQIEIVQEDNI